MDLSPEILGSQPTGIDPSKFGVLETDLKEFEQLPEAQHLQRLLADRILLDELMLTQYKGRAWEAFATRMVRYGISVVRGWVRNGKIFVLCAKRRRPVSNMGQIPTPDIEDLVQATVADALLKFRDKVLVPGRWDSTKGATLATFFIGQCLLQFPNHYRLWWRQSRPLPPHRGAVWCEQLSKSFYDPEERVSLRQQIEQLPEGIPEIASGKVMGLSNEQIGVGLGSSKRSAESKFWYFTNQIKKRANGPSSSD
jgi:hypothetical protein